MGKTYGSPPWGFPNKGDFLPKLVKTWMASIQNPERTKKPVMYSPRRISVSFGQYLLRLT
jgi:hypothetical protein